MAVSVRVGLHGNGIHVVEFALGEDIPFLGIFVMGRVRELLWGDLSDMG